MKMDAPKVKDFKTSLDDLAGKEQGRGRLRDVLVEILEIDEKTGVIKVKEVGDQEREFYAAPNERMHKDAQIVKTADFQGNLVDSRLEKAFPEGSKVVLEGLLDYTESDLGKDAEKPLQYRWLSSAPRDYVDENDNVHKKVITGTISALGYTSNDEFKAINVFLFSKEAKKVDDLVELFDEQYVALWSEYQKEQETGERGPVKPKYGFALVALNKENEVVACFPPTTNHAGSAFQDAVKGISTDENVRNWYKYAPPSGEELKQIASAYEKELQGMGYDDVHLEAVLVKSYSPSKNLKGTGVKRLSEMHYPLFLDKNNNEPVLPRFGGGIAVVKEGVISLSPGKFNQRTNKIEGGENDFVNHLYASARREPWPSALGMKLSPEYDSALEITKREWTEKMQASRGNNEASAKVEDAANKAEKVAEKNEVPRSKPEEISEKALDSASISEVADVAAQMSDAPEM